MRSKVTVAQAVGSLSPMQAAASQSDLTIQSRGTIIVPIMVPLSQALGRKMKLTQAHISVVLAIAASVAFFAGASALVVTYAPQVPADAIAKAQDRAYLLILFAVLGFVASSALAGNSLRQSPKCATLALSITVLSLLFPLAVALFA